MNIKHFGTLYIVATPIGNLQDMTPRAVATLKTVNWIAAEDTRHSAALLQHFSISTPMLSLHEHNEEERTHKLLEQLQKGESIALISDAGTPLISDPGFFLVRKARQQGIKVIPIPGACALIAALSVAGLPTNRFSFEGFLPAKSKQRKEQLELLQYETQTLIFYEAPHRVLDCLKDMESVFGKERQVVMVRELTKMYETLYGAPLKDLIPWVEKDENQQRGEIVLLVEGAANHQEQEETISLETILQTLLSELSLKQSVELAAKMLGKRKNEIYQLALKLKDKE